MRKVIAFLLCAGSLTAQTDFQTELDLGEVVVTDNRIETSVMESGRVVQVLTQEQITQLPVTTVNELLQHVSGVDFRQRGAWGAQADVSLRGGNFDQTLILVNGIKVTDPQTGHHNMNLGIDLKSVKQVEVIKGPAAARYGINSFNGAINIITKPSNENQVMIGSSAGQAHDSKLPDEFYAGYDLTSSIHLGTKKSRHMLSGTRLQSSGYRPVTDLSRHSLFYQSITETKAGNFNLMGSFVKNDFGASGFYAFPIDSTSEEQVETYLAALEHTLQKGRFMFRTKGYLRKNFDTYTLFRDSPEVFQNNHRTDVGGAEVHTTFTYALGTAGIGLEYRQEAISSNNLGQRLRDNYGLFAENRLWLLKSRLILNTGFYINQASDYDLQFLPSADLNYSFSKALNAFASWGRSFRVPTFTDLYYSGPTNIGNPNLKPEKSTNYEAGLKLGRGGHFVQVSSFLQQSTDLIDWVRDSLSKPWQPRNYEAVNTTGVDVDYVYRFTRSINNVITWDMARVNYTWLNLELQNTGEVISRYALNNLQHQLVMQSAWMFGDHISFTASARYLNRVSYKDYWLLDARLKYATERFSVFAVCTNLLGTEYVEAGNAPMPSRWYRLGFDWRIL